MRVGLATLAVFVALGAAAPAPASVPIPWCGVSSAVDRPDATPGYAFHVLYVRAPGTADRLAGLAPLFVGDAAAIEAWWRGDDPTRSPRFDLFAAPGCTSPFGALDITSVELPRPISDARSGFAELRSMLFELGFREAEKAYLAYYDGPTGQESSDEVVCGAGAAPSFRRPGMAVVFLDSCGGDSADVFRPVVAAQELVHTLGAVSSRAPNSCQGGHVCDAESDLMRAFLSASELEALVLDAGRDDYYGHSGTWNDVQDSLFLERLDSPDLTAPTTPAALRVGDAQDGLVRISWGASQDDVGPVAYRVYENGTFLRELAQTSTVLLPQSRGATRYSVRAADAVGHLSPAATGRFLPGVGMVDEAGRLVRDTVRPRSIGRVAIRRTAKSVSLRWPPVRDAGGIRSYRVRVGASTILVRGPAITIARSRLRAPVSIAAVDRAGNIGPALAIPLSRLR